MILTPRKCPLCGLLNCHHGKTCVSCHIPLPGVIDQASLPPGSEEDPGAYHAQDEPPPSSPWKKCHSPGGTPRFPCPPGLYVSVQFIHARLTLDLINTVPCGTEPQGQASECPWIVPGPWAQFAWT